MAVLTRNLHIGERVRHLARTEWGLGKVVGVDRCGTVRVIFEGNRELSIAKAAQHLKRVTLE